MMSSARALLLTRYDALDPSARLRLLQFVPGLEQAGWAVDVQTLFDAQDLRHLYATGRRDWLKLLRAYVRRLQHLLAAGRYDVIWVQRELFPYLPGAFERLIGSAAQRCILDYDDAIFLRYEQHPNWITRRLLGRKLHPLLSRVALVTACSDYLCDQLAQRGARRTAQVPTVIDPARYRLCAPRPPAPGASALPPDHGCRLRLGWIGTPTTTPYLSALLPVLKAVASRRPLQLVTVGAGPLAADGLELEAYPWSEQTEIRLLSSIDIGLMPLPEGPWERGKCAYKLIQYMASRKPVIASAVGVNHEVVTPEAGFLVQGEASWISALQRLGDSPSLRQRMGNAGRARVLAHYSTQQVLPQLLGLMRQLLAAP